MSCSCPMLMGDSDVDASDIVVFVVIGRYCRGK